MQSQRPHQEIRCPTRTLVQNSILNRSLKEGTSFLFQHNTVWMAYKSTYLNSLSCSTKVLLSKVIPK